MPVPLVTSVLLADDHPLFRRGLRQVVDREPDLQVVAEASDGAEAVERALGGGGDVQLVLLDVTMPRMTGLQAAREITRGNLGIRVLMLSMHDNERLWGIHLTGPRRRDGVWANRPPRRRSPPQRRLTSARGSNASCATETSRR